MRQCNVTKAMLRRLQQGPTCHIQLEALQARHGDDAGVVDGCVKGVHGEGGGAVHDAVSRLQHAAHEQVYELICPAAHLPGHAQLGMKLVRACM